MFCKLLWLLFIPAGLAFLAWYTSAPLPEYAEKDWILVAATRYSFITIKTIAWVLDAFGLGHPIINTRRISHFLALVGLQTKADDAILVKKEVFDGVSVLTYVPKDAKVNGAGLVFVHGGGYVIGNPQIYDKQVRTLVRTLGVVAVSLDYRLAPEHTYPVPLDDCERATRYFMKNAHQWNVDPSRIGVAGDSAGGGLSSTLAVRWTRKILEGKEAPEHPLRVLLLIYPVTQFVNFSTNSYILNAQDYLLPKEQSIKFKAAYLYGERGLRNSTFLSALYVNNYTTRVTRARLAPKFQIDDELLSTFRQIVNSVRLPEEIADVALREETRIVQALRDGTPIVVTPQEAGTTVKLPAIKKEQQHPKGDPILEHEVFALMSHEEVSPLLAPQEIFMHPAWPSTWVASMGHDFLRDDAIMFYKRVKEAVKESRLYGKHESSKRNSSETTKKVAETAVEHKHYSNKFHGWFSMHPEPIADDIKNFIVTHPGIW